MIQYHYLLHLSNEEKGDIIYPYNSKVYSDKANNWDFNKIQEYRNNKYILYRFSYDDLVTNEYIEYICFSLFNVHIKLIDSPKLSGYCCPCCKYIVYNKIELCNVCPVCNWEITNTGEDEYSPPNHSTLKEFRQIFTHDKNMDSGNPKFIQYGSS